MVGSFLSSFWMVDGTKYYLGMGTNIVMKSTQKRSVPREMINETPFVSISRSGALGRMGLRILSVCCLPRSNPDWDIADRHPEVGQCQRMCAFTGGFWNAAE